MVNKQTELSAYGVDGASTDEPTEGWYIPNKKAQIQETSKSDRFNTGDPLANEYLEEVSGPEIQKSTAKRYETALKSFIRHLKSENVSLVDSKMKHVKSYLRETARSNLATSTLNTRHTAIKKLYRYIISEREESVAIEIVAVERISTSGFTTRDRVEKEPLSETEIEKLAEATNSHRDRIMILVGSETGARNESLRTMKLKHVDLNAKKPGIVVPNTKSGGEGFLPISDELALELDRWTAYIRDSIGGNPDEQYLFPSQGGGMMKSGENLGSIIHRAAVEASIQKVTGKRKATKAEKRAGTKKDMVKFYRVTPHLLRHTFSLFLQEAGLDIETRRDALDHESIETTEKHYTHTKSDYQDLIRKFLHNTDEN